MTNQYARKGYLFYSVITPSVALEYELPDTEYEEELDANDWWAWVELNDTAEAHRTSVKTSPYALL